MLPLLVDEQRLPLRVRTVGCDCEDPDCTARFVTASTVVVPELWVASVYADDAQDAAFGARYLLANELGEFEERPFDVVERACALIGLEWRVLTASADPIVRQYEAFARLPQWMFRVPAESIRAVRGCVFGRAGRGELSRVPAALEALHGFYVPDSLGPSAVPS